jgi:hypothetical protein
MKTFVYVDAFNLYFGAVRGTPYKWLDLNQLCRILLPSHEIVQIKYFTARVNARPSDPDQPTRQRKSALTKSQFSSPMQDDKGTFFKPHGW